jgi:hypothetical protein
MRTQSQAQRGEALVTVQATRGASRRCYTSKERPVAMDANRFDSLLRQFGEIASRRDVARLGALAIGVTSLLELVAGGARKKRGKHKKKKKRCKGGAKKCGKTCIPAANCCSSADCGVCESCQNGQCASGCDTGQECVAGACRCATSSCDGCCDGDACHDGNSDGNCGHDGDVCVTCSGGKTCQSGSCACPGEQQDCNGACIAQDACCIDGVQNGSESGVDCGGTCPRCFDGSACVSRDDCQSALCLGTPGVGGFCSECRTSPNDNCGSDADGTCVCDRTWQLLQLVCDKFTPESTVSDCEECPADTNCVNLNGTLSCIKYCGAT